MIKQFVGPLLLLAPALFLPLSLQAAHIIIDDFSADQGPFNTDIDAALDDTSILGDQRDLSLFGPPNSIVSADVSGGSLVTTIANTGQGSIGSGFLWLTYDGVDANASRFGTVTPGLNAFDITDGGNNTQFAISLGQLSGDPNSNSLIVTVNAANLAGGNTERFQRVDITTATSNSTVYIDFASYDATVDFTSVNFIQLVFDGVLDPGQTMSTEITNFMAIPEPQSISFLGLTLTALVLRRRR